MDTLMQCLPEKKKVILNGILEHTQKVLKNEFDYKQVKMSEWKGYRFPPLLEGATAKRAYEDMNVEENTVFIVSFPKSGTNWISEVVRQVLYGGDEKLDLLSKNLSPFITFLTFWTEDKLELIEHIPLPRKIFSTHLPSELFNLDKVKQSKGKVIVVIRNPKDQAVSWFHMSKINYFDAVREEMSSDWENFFAEYIEGKHRLDTKLGEWYPEFLLSWYKHRNDDNVLFVYFEDMKKDPHGEIFRIAEFLDVHLTKERIDAVARNTSIENVIKVQHDSSTSISEIQQLYKLVRKGQVGSWKEIFTVAQSELMDKLIEEKLGHTDIKFTYSL